MSRAAARVIGRSAAIELADAWRSAGDRIVLANGVFDLLHVGHARYLSAARSLGTRLIVALNGDRSSAASKEAGRPVVRASDRAVLVAALRGVDAVVIFEDPTVDGLLRELRPAVHAKGTDYRTETVPERETAEALHIQTVIAGDPKTHASRDLVRWVREHGSAVR
jgi:D-glycero-beta-D-manno-heptose 1-phosphate adenylyltransferase